MHLLTQCLASDVLHYQEVHTFLRIEIVNRGDVRMVELRERECFLAKSLASRVASQHACVQDLQRDVSLQTLIVRTVDLPHAARAYLLDNAVVGDGVPYQR